MTGWLAHLALASFLAGIAGGVHCAAMCGPLLAACAGSRAVSPGWRRTAAYNVGRVASYTAAGALAGLFGGALLTLRGGASAAAAAALLAGSSMLVLALHLAGFTPVTRALESAGGRVWRVLAPYSRRLLPADNTLRALGLGALWGWIPCGMVYAVLLTAAATAEPAQGALVALAFGLGTLPNVLGIALAANRIKRLLRFRSVRYAAAAVVAAFGALGLSFAVSGHSYGFSDLCRLLPAAGPLAGVWP
jgi:sulfite exporter TauE/SafE